MYLEKLRRNLRFARLCMQVPVLRPALDRDIGIERSHRGTEYVQASTHPVGSSATFTPYGFDLLRGMIATGNHNCGAILICTSRSGLNI